MRLIDAEETKRNLANSEEVKFKYISDFNKLCAFIDSQPTVAASPWHRVEDKLPVKGEIVIVSDGKRTWDVGQYHCLVSSDDRTKWWWKGHTIKTVKWWMRKKDALPEPPKEDA